MKIGALFGLYLVITDPAVGYENCAAAAVRAGTRFVQLRMKNEPRERVRDVAVRLRRITAGTRTALIINDDPALAAEIGADGVHLGQDDMPIPEARERFPQLKIFGLSTHSVAQVEAARELAPDYIGLGPVYATPTKKNAAALGLETLGKMAAAAPCPGVAIGGINTENLADVLRAGARNYSVVRAVCAQADPYAAILRLQAIWEKTVKA